MKTRDLIVGFMVLVAIVAIVLVYKNSKKVTPVVTNPTPDFQQVESKFPALKVPANADRISLNDVSGGTAMGEAFKTFEGGKFSVTLMANLPAPSAGNVYKGYLINGNTQILLGNLTSEKGGYIVNFTSNQDLTSYKQVVVMLGSTHILEGSF